MSATIMCALCTVAFTFKTSEVNWLWTENKPAAIILGIAALFFATQWFKHHRMVQHEPKR